jgi:CRP-like cAMP-binding protein
MLRKTANIEQYRQLLKEELGKIADVEDRLLDEFVAAFHIQEFSPKTMVIRAGVTSTNLYFVVKGLLRRYYVVNDREIIVDFIDERKLFTCTYSIITGITNAENYETLENTVCLVADHAEIERMFKTHHRAERLARKMVEQYYSFFLIESYNKLFLTAEERYDIFLKERSGIARRVSLKYVAAYLGITPETLSRIRSKR